MFFSTGVATGLISSEGEYLNSQIFGFGITSSNGQFTILTAVSTCLSQATGNFQSINPFFSPNRFKFFFGNQATQDIDKIVIQKAELTGLSSSSSNTAESLLVGILNKIISNKNTVSFPGISFSYWGYGFTDGKRVDTVLIDIRNKLTITNKFEIQDTSGNVDPDHY